MDENKLYQFGEWYVALFIRAAAPKWLGRLTDVLDKAYLLCETELLAVSLMQGYKMSGNQIGTDYSQIAFVITQRRTVSGLKYFIYIYCILKTSFYF